MSCSIIYNLPFGYAGQYRDEESELLYMRARYYDAETEQFISRDPSVEVSGQPYVYAGGNPINATDPTGHFPWLLAAGIVALGIGSSMAADVGGDFLFDNANFDFWTSLGHSVSDPWTYLGAVPVPGGGPITKSIRLAVNKLARVPQRNLFEVHLLVWATLVALLLGRKSQVSNALLT